MKRVKAACITQTLHFLLKEDIGKEYAKKLVTEEVKRYKEQLDKNKTKYKILSEETQADGSVIILSSLKASVEWLRLNRVLQLLESRLILLLLFLMKDLSMLAKKL